MSKESAREFITRLKDDASLQAKVDAQGPDVSIDSLLDVAAANGYNFTKEEFITTGTEMANEAVGEGGQLSDEQLDAVAGGALISITYKTVTFTIHTSKATA